MEPSTIQFVKQIIIDLFGLSKDALHMHVGLAVMFVLILVLRKPFGSWLPFLGVVIVAALGEFLDRRDDIASLGYWRWSASLHDFVNTLFWPFILVLLARIGLLKNRRVVSDA